MAQTLAARLNAPAPSALIARVCQTADGIRTAYLGTQRCYFDADVSLPEPGTTLDVRLSHPVYARDAEGYVDYTRMLGLKVRVLSAPTPAPIPSRLAAPIPRQAMIASPAIPDERTLAA